MGIPNGTTLTISQIQDRVSSSFPLTAEDEEPYTKTRNTTYSKWCHHVQSVMHELKDKGLVVHNVSAKSYTF